MKSVTLLGFIFLFTIGLQAQDRLSLEECIQLAQRNSLSVKQAQIGISQAELTLKGSQMSRLPNLNANFGGGFQFGRTIDPTTDAFINEAIGSNSINASTGVLLYNGNVINNSINQGKMDLEASKLDADNAANDIGLSVASTFLSILLAEEQLENARKRSELSQEQLERTDKLIEAGSLPQNDRLDFISQIAREQQAIIEAQNLVTINYLNLKQLLVIDPNETVEIERPDLTAIQTVDPDNFQINEIYTSALANQPNIAANELRVNSSILGEKIAKASLIPSLSASGNISSFASNKALDFLNPDLSDVRVVLGKTQLAQVAGQDVPVAFYGETGVTFPKRGYFNQLNDNLGQSISMNINIPIYNRHANKINVERARLNTLNAQVTDMQTRQTLKANVQRSIADAQAAKEALDAAQTSVDAALAAFNNGEKRFELGVINTLEYITTRSNYDQAQVELTRAKFQYVFNVKVVEFYQGKQLSLN